MTFLARLIGRHLGDVPVPLPILEPRLPSRFEPAAPAAAPWAGEWDVEAPGDPEPRISAAPGSAWEAPRSPARGELLEGAMPRAGVMSTALGTVSAPLHATASHAAPTGTPGALSPVVERHPAAPARPSTAPAVPDLAASDTSAERPAARPPNAAPPSLRPPAPASRAIRAERERAEARGGPTIHVTIGRVDVRAVVASVAAPPGAPAPAQTSSLEDYLRGPGGGRR
jgi:hypothetical protein